MNKKWYIAIIIFALILFITSVILVFVMNKTIAEKNTSDSLNNQTENAIDISSTYVVDDCMNEWADYAKTIEEDIKSTNSGIVDENTHFLVKDVDGYITIYYIDDSGEEILYNETEISTEYLSVTDLDDLEIGIEVVGYEELNKLIENFE